jgi:hypothetical protein
LALSKKPGRSTHVHEEFGQRYGDTGFGQVEDGVRPGKGFPVKARAVSAVQREDGRIRLRQNIGSQGWNGDPIRLAWRTWRLGGEKTTVIPDFATIAP